MVNGKSDLFLGGSLAYERDLIDSDRGLAHVSDDALHLGAFIKTRQGSPLMSLAITAGMGWYDARREVTIGQHVTTARASPFSQYVGGHFGIGYHYAFGDFDLLPQVTLDATYVHVRPIWYQIACTANALFAK